ncbi:AAA family ATPase [Aliarcobacter butzleri]|uniref:AAA family ATPase n=1 Tax=Aliarcobacter butzleri TaxID=28197 RepID=UPI003B227FC5
MELVYLWVENYKNIQKQGFNFSPRFECEFFPKYDKDGKLEDNCELKITSKDYVNIFPDNINVTAIVGENGSGKSTIIEFLQAIFCKIDFLNKRNNLRNELKNLDKNLNEAEFILLFIDTEKNEYLLYNSIEISNKNISDLFNLEKSSITIDEITLIFNKLIKNFDFYGQLNCYTNSNIKELIIENSQNEDRNFIDNLVKYLSHKKTMPISFFNPDTILINLGIDFKKNDFFNNLIEFVDHHYYKMIEKINIGNEDKIKEDKESKLKVLKHYKDLYNSYFQLVSEFTGGEYLYKFIGNYENKEEISNLFYHLEEFRILEIYDSSKNKYVYKYALNLGLNYDDLSSGEKDNLYLLMYLYNKITYKIGKENVCIFLDEPTNSYHPNWQKEFIKILIDFIKNLKFNSLQIIITSHSPFILSDIPKENVIFLEKYKKDEDKNQKEGNCKNVSKDIELKTFGANIHTLLSDGFFMSDGLMGEFAKSKITKILRFLNDDNKFIDISQNTKIPFLLPKDYLAKKLKPIIESIGEDFLRNKLLDLYYKKFTEDKKEKEKLILKNKIDELQRQYDELDK